MKNKFYTYEEIHKMFTSDKFYVAHTELDSLSLEGCGKTEYLTVYPKTDEKTKSGRVIFDYDNMKKFESKDGKKYFEKEVKIVAE